MKTPYRILAIIPARSGSKGLRHKNIKKLAGVPLLARAVEAAKKSRRRGEEWSVVVSTDSAAYARLARRAGAIVPGLRPRRLATDESRLIDAVIHAVEERDQPAGSFDAVIMLSPTCPLRATADVRGALEVFRAGGGESVASVTLDPFAPSWRFELDGGLLDRRPRQHRVGRRQEESNGVVLNGAVYIASPGWLRRYRQFVRAGRTRAFVMPRERSVDIEDALDFQWAELLWQRQGHRATNERLASSVGRGGRP